MAVPKIVQQVRSCGECPNYVYYSAGVRHCRLVDQRVRDKDVIAPFCPLPDYPARVIADMQATIAGLRNPNEYDFGHALLSYVSAKLRLNMMANRRGIEIPLADGSVVEFGLDFISELRAHPFEVVFMHGDKAFRLLLDATGPGLQQQEFSGDEELWQRLRLAK